MKLAEEGLPTITALGLGAVVFAVFLPWRWPEAVLIVLCGFVLWFYRDPDRTLPTGEGLLEGEEIFVSPADGKVVEIVPASHPFTGGAVKIGIFMNAFSVHVNRSPCRGVVEYLEYVPGRKIAAFAPKASEVNERHCVGLRTDSGPVLLVQIAGLLARRIVCRVRRGDVLSPGERYGMIKLGSKVDIYLPESVKLSVKVGDKVYAGKSSLGTTSSKVVER
ncbi:MAG: phosphatidylserine decarboxylase family protein [Synergistaceae bacterium]|nr:phosphatidylserine decarboxylase family protein [Synergistaceae bacterium]